MSETEFPAEGERSISESFDLPHEQFLRWWNMLAPEDRDEFRWLYQGDELCARFVCALDLLVIAKVQGGDQQSLIQLAYHIAAKPYAKHACELSSPELRQRAHRYYNHQAVQALLERVRLRTRLRERIRIENLVLQEAERMLKDCGNEGMEMKDRAAAMNVALKIMDLSDAEQARMRAERTRNGLERARHAALNGDADETPAVMQATVKALAAKLGKDKVIEMLSE